MTVWRRFSKLAAVTSLFAGLVLSFNPALSQTSETGKTDSGKDIMELLMKPSPLGDIELGNKDAKVTVVEFSSITCNHCAYFAQDVFPKIKANYIDTGKIRYIMRDLAFDGTAVAGYALARCMGNDKFISIRDHFFNNFDRFREKSVAEVLRDLSFEAGIPKEKFMSCVGDKRVLEGIKAVREQAIELGISGTPTFFINGEQIVGGQPYEEMSRLLDAALKKNN